jgi:hypothetical protein
MPWTAASVTFPDISGAPDWDAVDGRQRRISRYFWRPRLDVVDSH